MKFLPLHFFPPFFAAEEWKNLLNVYGLAIFYNNVDPAWYQCFRCLCEVSLLIRQSPVTAGSIARLKLLLAELNRLLLNGVFM